MKRTELLNEQELALMEEFKRQTINFGFSTVNSPEKKRIAEESIKKIYSFIGEKPPKVVFTKGPIEMCKTFQKETKTKVSIYDTIFYTQWRLAWLSFYQFPAKHLGIKYDDESQKQADAWLDCLRNVFIMIPTDETCYVSEFPVEIHRDSLGRLHNINGPALRCADGWELYKVAGISVPKELIEDHSLITLARINAEKNAEVRRVLMEIYGWSNYIKDSGAVLIDEYKDQMGHPVRLWKKDLGPEFTEPIVMVELINSTIEGIQSPNGFIPLLNEKGETYFKSYMFRVDPKITSARKAHAWHIGLDQDEVVFKQQS